MLKNKGNDMSSFLNIDCMIGMAEYPDNHFELAIVDPPYGIGFDGETTVKGKGGKASTFSDKQHHVKKEWDSNTPDKEYFNELIRVSKNQIIWGGNYFTDKIPVSRGWIYWDKKITNANNKNFSDGELAWTSFNKILKKYTYDWIGFGYLNNQQRERKIHPTQKPVEVYKFILTDYAKSGDKILDTHVGSARSLIACIDMGFEYTGFELDTDYYNAAKNRIKLHTDQLVMV